MKTSTRYLIIIFGLILLFYLDFVRDYVFKNIGFQIYYLNHLSSSGVASIENYTDSFIEQFFNDYSIKQLNNLKWFFTAFFILLFGALGALINNLFHKTKKVFIYFLLLYSFLFLSSIVIYFSMKLTNSYSYQAKAYLMSMEIAHFLQSSLPTLLFLVSFKLYQRNKA